MYHKAHYLHLRCILYTDVDETSHMTECNGVCVYIHTHLVGSRKDVSSQLVGGCG